MITEHVQGEPLAVLDSLHWSARRDIEEKVFRPLERRALC